MAHQASPIGNVARRQAAPYDLLLVSGLAGSGKSTFIEMLHEGRLSQELTAALPEGSNHWTIVYKDGRPKGSNTPLTADMIKHYDIVSPHRRGIKEFSKDPALNILRRSQAPFVVVISVSQAQLSDQFGKRLQQQLKEKSALRRLWREWVRLPLRRALIRLNLASSRQATVDFYRDPEWVSRCFQDWEAYLVALQTEKPNARLIRITPYLDDNNRPAFRLSDP